MTGLRRWFAALPAVFLFAGATAFGVAAISPAVQVAINYGPGKSLMISGVIVGEGEFVLTQANVLRGAREIVVALTNTDVLDAVIERVDAERNVALLRISPAVNAPLAMLEAFPPGNVGAVVLGAPEAFQTSKLYVQLQPVSGQPGWRIVPAIPPAFRGAPILSVSGTLLGIAIERREGDFADGIPITELRDFIFGPAEAGVSPNPDRQGRPISRDQAAAVRPVDEAAAKGAAKPAEQAPPVVAKAAEQAPPAAVKLAGQPPPAKPAEQPPPVTTKPAEQAPPAAKPAEQTPPAAAKAATGGVKTAAAKTSREQNPSELSPVEQWKVRIAAEPTNADLRFAFAGALMTGGLYREAGAVLQRAIADFPSNAQVYWHLAQLYWQQGTRKANGAPRNGMDRASYLNCMRALETFLERAPGDPHAAEARSLLNALRQTKR